MSFLIQLTAELNKLHTATGTQVVLVRQRRGRDHPTHPLLTDFWNKIIMELQPQSGKQNYLLRLGFWGTETIKVERKPIGFDEVCLCLAKTVSFLRVSWKCLQNIPGLVFAP